MTTLLPGSANLIGGRGVTLQERARLDLPGDEVSRRAVGLKMACGENPKRVYGEQGRRRRRAWATSPATAQAFADAAGLPAPVAEVRGRSRCLRQEKARTAIRPSGPCRRSATCKLETLAGVLQGEILVHIHCYRADEMR